jgi:alkylation response protein AidB-like acyl-CoA dehydrogenase
MDMELSEEQELLRNSAREFLERECPPALVRDLEQSDTGFSQELWKQMAALGWLGLPMPEAHGGAAMGAIDLVVLCRELGRALCPSPYLSAVVFSGGAIAAAGTSSQQQDYLPRLVNGEMIIAFALQELNGRMDSSGVATRARAEGDGFTLHGEKMFVEFAGSADLLLVPARSDAAAASSAGLTMFLVDPRAPGVTLEAIPTMARDRQYRVTLDGVQVQRDMVVGPVGDAWASLERVVERGTVAFCAYIVGATEKMHEMATDYAKDRVQFGRPIGSFQLIQGYLAQLITEIWGAETLVYYAASCLDDGLPARDVIAKAKAFAGDCIKRTTDVGSQIFGGIGYMEDMDNTLFLRRGKQYQLALGDTGYWEDVIADEILGPIGAT